MKQLTKQHLNKMVKVAGFQTPPTPQKIEYIINRYNTIINLGHYDKQNKYFEIIKLCYNQFITNHCLTDGNKRMYKIVMDFTDEQITWEDLH